MVRGIERRRIFRSDRDRRDLTGRLSRLCLELDARCYAWVFLSNHFHLVVRANGAISRLMARLNTGYARGFNRRHDRVGYLFQNRFRSRLVVDDTDLQGLILYVHRNPIEAGLARTAVELAAYPWCGHGALMGARAPYPFEAVEASLRLFAPEPEEARRQLARWMDPPEPGGDAPPAPAAPLAGPAVPTRSESDRERVAALADAVSRALHLDPSRVYSGTRTQDVCDARAATAWLAVERLGLSGRCVGDCLGISRSAVSHSLARGRRVVEAHGLNPKPAPPPRG